MRRLGKTKAQNLLDEMRKDTSDPNHWMNGGADSWQKSVRLEFPLGELTNEHISGFVSAWARQEKIQTERIKDTDRFSAQGLEGKATIQVTLFTALLVWETLGEFRCAIYVD